MAAVYYTEQKAWDLYNLGNDYPVSGYGYASAQIMSAFAHGKPGDLDYYVSAWKWVPDVHAGDKDGVPSGRFAIDGTGLYSNPSGTELPFLFPSGVYATASAANAPDTITFPTELNGMEADDLLGVDVKGKPASTT